MFQEQMKKNEPHFKKQEWRNGTYFGKTRSNLPNGYGKWVNFDGKRKIEAEWSKGKRNGVVI